MPILFGWGRTTVKDHGECIAATCPRCHNSVLLHHLLITVWFTLFFIPVIPYKRKRALMCGICQWSRPVPKEAIALTDDMQEITKQWRAGQMVDAEYEQRVAAYWSFQSDSPAPQTTGAASSDDEPDDAISPEPPPPPA